MNKKNEKSGKIIEDDQYNLKTNHIQITADVNRIKSTVAVSTSHNLLDTDKINIEIIPEMSVGLGNTSPINIKFDTINQKILLNQ